MDKKTNEQLLLEIINHSRYGALAQVFVIDALYKFAKKVAASSPEEYGDGMLFIHPDSWIGVAKEIELKIKQHLEDA